MKLSTFPFEPVLLIHYVLNEQLQHLGKLLYGRLPKLNGVVMLTYR